MGNRTKRVAANLIQLVVVLLTLFLFLCTPYNAWGGFNADNVSLIRIIATLCIILQSVVLFISPKNTARRIIAAFFMVYYVYRITGTIIYFEFEYQRLYGG